MAPTRQGLIGHLTCERVAFVLSGITAVGTVLFLTVFLRETSPLDQRIAELTADLRSREARSVELSALAEKLHAHTMEPHAMLVTHRGSLTGCACMA